MYGHLVVDNRVNSPIWKQLNLQVAKKAAELRLNIHEKSF